MSGRRSAARLAALVAVTVAVVMLLPLPANAQTGPATTPIRTLPFLGTGDVLGHGSGGAGTSRGNAAVARECNAGTAIEQPQWYRLAGAEFGYVVARADAPYYPRGVEQNPAGQAVLDARTGSVLSCDSVAVPTRYGHPLEVVAYYREPVEHCADPVDPQYCADGSLRLVVSAASRATGPGNDHWQRARAVGALPYTGHVDATFADADVSGLIDYDHCLLSSIEPAELNTTWWRYTARSTGPAPSLSATADDAWPAAVAYRPSVAIMERSASGLVLAPRSGSDPWDCQAPTVLQKGRTYYFVVFTAADRYDDSTPLPSGRVTLRVGAQRAPSAVTGLTAWATPTAGSSPGRVAWAAPASGPAPTAYRVVVERRTFGGHWRVVRSSRLPASSRSWTPARAAVFRLAQTVRFTVTPWAAGSRGASASITVLPRAR